MPPWWSFNSLKQRLGRFRFLLLLLVVLGTASWLSFQFGRDYNVNQQDKFVSQEQRLADLYYQMDQKIRQINYLSVELEVEQNASLQMQQELFDLRQESFQLRKELNFYQKVVAPELSANGISIEQFQVEPTADSQHASFQFALVQTDSKKRYAKGRIELTLHGVTGDEKQTFNMADLAQLGKKELAFSFHYFQYFSGELMLPEGFIPQQLEVKVIVSKSKYRAYRSFSEKLNWSEAILSPITAIVNTP